MKALIVYYSLTGHTKTIAERLAAMLQCDIVRVPMFGSPEIDWGRKYDLVIIGTPIWFWAPVFSISRFLAKNRDRLPHVAFFCTYGTSIGKSFEKMGRKCKKQPLGTLKISELEIGTEAREAKIQQFIDEISEASRPGSQGR